MDGRIKMRVEDEKTLMYRMCGATGSVGVDSSAEGEREQQ